MSSEPLVSVIVSAYNVEKFIREALFSILDQRYKNIEIVIADDGSTDLTKLIIDSIDDSRIRRFHNEKNIGLLRTWNKLLSLTRGAYITFQDGDDMSLPGRIDRLVSFLESNPEVGLCGTNFIRHFKTWDLCQMSDYPLTDEKIREKIKGGEVPFNGTRVMIRRDVYLSIGGFREFFIGLAGEDFDWILRISEHYKVANIQDVLYEYRYFSRSASKYSLDSSVERVYVTKIIFFLAKQRINHGLDSLQTSQIAQIQEFLSPYRKELENDKTNYIRYNKVFSNLLSNKDFVTAIVLFFRRFLQYPFQATNFFDFYRLASGFIRTVIKSILHKTVNKNQNTVNCIY